MSGRFVKGADGKSRTRKNIVDETQDLTADVEALKSGTNFSFPGPYSNDSAAASAGVAIGSAYFGPGGGVVIRQT